MKLNRQSLRRAGRHGNCNFNVKLNKNASMTPNAISFDIIAANQYDNEASAKLSINIIKDSDHMNPIIDVTKKTLTIKTGAMGTAAFTRQYIKNWDYDALDDEDK